MDLFLILIIRLKLTLKITCRIRVKYDFHTCKQVGSIDSVLNQIGMARFEWVGFSAGNQAWETFYGKVAD